MRFFPLFSFFLLGILLRAGTFVPAEDGFRNSDAGVIDAFVEQQMADHRIPGLALAVTEGDELVLAQGYGEGITPQTQFFIASVSKSFTALAVMQLVEAGRIRLDEPAQSYLPDFRVADQAASQRITVRQLLNQVSGMAEVGFSEYQPPQPTTIAARVDSLQTARLVAEPGTEYHYFSPNYAVLARLVEVVSGEPFNVYLQEHIFAPLDMGNTFGAITADEAMQQAQALAPGHITVFGASVPVQELTGYVAGSGVISTAEDLGHYLVMQNSEGRFGAESLAAPESIKLMHTPPPGIESPYAMGWLAEEYDGVRTIEHNGILSAYYAEVVLLPETQQGIALLYNTDSLPATLLAFPDIKRGLIDLLAGRQPAVNTQTTTWYTVAISLLALLGIALAILSLVRLPHWFRQHSNTPTWRLLPGILLTFVPAIVLVLLPTLVTAGSERVFSTEMLVRSMADIYIWLGVCAVLGVLNGTLRLGMLMGRRLRPAN